MSAPQTPQGQPTVEEMADLRTVVDHIAERVAAGEPMSARTAERLERIERRLDQLAELLTAVDSGQRALAGVLADIIAEAVRERRDRSEPYPSGPRLRLVEPPQ